MSVTPAAAAEVAPAEVFISHAGPDRALAASVASLLEARGIVPLLDRAMIDAGDDFLAFMESALGRARYCLLLWSGDAARSEWVGLEWRAALVRSVQEHRAFLVVGRLEALPLPNLLAPRLWVDLFPDLEPGVQTFADAWRADRAAEAVSGRPVVAAGPPPEPAGAPLYLTSELFAFTRPIRANLSEPAGVLLDRALAELGLPRQLSYDGRVGVRFEYTLAHGDEPLERARALAAQGIEPGAVLGLRASLQPYAAATPASGALGQAVFRERAAPVGPAALERRAWRALERALAVAGLR